MFENTTLPAWLAGTSFFIALASFAQSGKALGFLVRQTINWPLVLRSPLMFNVTSTPAGTDAISAFVPRLVPKMAKAKIGAANFVPKPKV